MELIEKLREKGTEKLTQINSNPLKKVGEEILSLPRHLGVVQQKGPAKPLAHFALSSIYIANAHTTQEESDWTSIHWCSI